MRRQSRPVPRHPLAFGITWWGPLPGTEKAAVLWTGPGGELLFCPVGATAPGVPMRPIRHPAASGTYRTVAEAEKAVNAFCAAAITDEAATGCSPSA